MKRPTPNQNNHLRSLVQTQSAEEANLPYCAVCSSDVGVARVRSCVIKKKLPRIEMLITCHGAQRYYYMDPDFFDDIKEVKVLPVFIEEYLKLKPTPFEDIFRGFPNQGGFGNQEDLTDIFNSIFGKGRR